MSIEKRLYIGAGVVGAFALGVILTLYIGQSGPQQQEQAQQPQPSVVDVAAQQNARQKAGATTGLSYVLRDSANPADLVKVREIPGGSNFGADPNIGVADALKDNTRVQLICWTEGSAPYANASAKWFFVKLVDPPHPGKAGYIWSDLVWDQIAVPQCTQTLTSVPDPLRNAQVTLAQGVPAPQGGYYYAVSLSGFPPGWETVVFCFDDTAPNEVFKQFPLTANGAGQAQKNDGCRSGEGIQHWVYADNVKSNQVTWKTPQTPGKPTPQATTPNPPIPDPPRTATLISYNKVTNGPTEMREDSSPTYLSSQTRPFCKPNGCALSGTDMGSGVAITGECWVTGDRMTNGQDNSSIDDNNPGLFTSTLWYRIRWPDGRSGFISEIWIQNRGTHGLARC